MNQEKHIFTIMAGCVPVGIKMLESYHKFHKEKIHVYMFGYDFCESSKEDQSFFKNMTVHLLDDELKNDFSQGHIGTAKAWAQIMIANPESYLIHIDSDVIFKKESLSLIEKAGYPDIYGSRRCYKNNPVGIPVAEGTEDAISTYFMAINVECIATDFWQYDVFVRMIQGAYNPLGFPVFDFFDPIFFHMRDNKATVYHEDSSIIGGQNEFGSKVNNYPSNLHLDMGSHLAHFGGVGSGYQASIDDSKMNKSYSEWAKTKWELFKSIFLNSDIVPSLGYNRDTVFDVSGRWISGPHNENIINQVREDLKN